MMKTITSLRIAFLFLIFQTSNLLSQDYNPFYNYVVQQSSFDNINTYLSEFQSLGVKEIGTTALDNTQNWIIEKYTNYGYTDIELNEFSYSGGTTANIIITKTGTVYPNKFLIIDGHYDTIHGPGANDNGSGTAIILELARLLKDIPTEYSIKFIHFSGEEDGLIGSNYYVDNVVVPQNMDILLVFNIDQVGGTVGTNNNTIVCEEDRGSPSHNNAASSAVTLELANCVSLYSNLNTEISYAYGSDYMPFEDNGEVITGFYEKNESPYSHTSNDLIRNMDPGYVYEITKASVGAALHFSKGFTEVPIIVSDAIASSDEDENYNYNIVGYHSDNEAQLTITNTEKPDWLSFSDNGDGTALLSGVPTNDQVGEYGIVLEISDGNNSSSQSFTLTVSNVNDAPVFTSEPILVGAENQLYTYHLTATDEDLNENLSFYGSQIPSWLKLTNEGDGTATLSGTPTNQYVVSEDKIYNITVRLSDGEKFVYQQFAIEVANTNDAPEFTSTEIISVNEDENYSYLITTNDKDGDDLIITISEKPDWLSFIDNNDGTAMLSGIPENDEVGVYNISIQVADEFTNASHDFSIEVYNTNDAPVFTSVANLNVNEDENYEYNITTSDVDSDSQLAITVVQNPEWLSIDDLGNGLAKLSGTPENDDVGVHEITLQVSDGIVTTDQTFNITVINQNDAPFFHAELPTEIRLCPGTISEELDIKSFVTDIDLEDEITVSELSTPLSEVLVDLNEGKLTVSHNALEGGNFDINISVKDNAGATIEAVINIVVFYRNPIISIEDKILTVQEADSYQWFKDGEALFGETKKTLAYNGVGDYHVEITYAEGCQAKSETFYIDALTNIADEDLDKLKIYPNPAHNYVNIDNLNNDFNLFELYTLEGKKVLVRKIVDSKIDLSNMPNGVYLLKLVAKDNRFLFKKLVLY